MDVFFIFFFQSVFLLISASSGYHVTLAWHWICCYILLNRRVCLSFCWYKYMYINIYIHIILRCVVSFHWVINFFIAQCIFLKFHFDWRKKNNDKLTTQPFSLVKKRKKKTKLFTSSNVSLLSSYLN